MKVLVACEYSGKVREAFRKLGHDAWSCDLLPADDGSPYHIQGDVLEILNDGWDMMIAHPPCTHLAVSGARWFKDEWWELDQKHLGWCKQLLFPEGFSISRSGKVHTPKISDFYRLAAIEKGSEEPDFSYMVTRIQKSLHQLKAEAMRWRGIIGIVYEHELPQRSSNTPVWYTHPELKQM